jgi:DNA-nicking Smr family endonuclease
MKKRSDNKKHPGSKGAFRPFAELKALIENKSIKLAPSPAQKTRRAPCKIASGSTGRLKQTNSNHIRPAAEQEHQLFREAMADVKPLAQNSCIEHGVLARLPLETEPDCETETLLELNHLIRHGKGFVVAHTPEYIEGTGHNVHPRFAKRLHRGDFSIQAHLDLHGLGVLEAKDAFDRFFKESIAIGKRAVLIIHGRGLSSPQRPVLKTRVIEWLTCGPWRKWVIAYTSARSCDGGAGATYVLLRQRPATKRLRKRRPIL